MQWRRDPPTASPAPDLGALLRADHLRWSELLDEIEGQLTVNRAAARAYHDTLALRLRGHLSWVESALIQDLARGQGADAEALSRRWREVARQTRDALAAWDLPLSRGEMSDPTLAAIFRAAVSAHEQIECDDLLPAALLKLGPDRIRAAAMKWETERPGSR